MDRLVNLIKGIMVPGFLIAVLTGSIWAVDVNTHYLGTGATYWNLPDTGQETGDYNGPAGADDKYTPAASQPSYTSYVISSDLVTVDNRTGLMWVGDGNSAGCNNGAYLDWEQALTFCEGLDFAGYTDWRLPNAIELLSICDFGPAPPKINQTYFPNSDLSVPRYWTSTTAMLDEGAVRFVNFGRGGVTDYDKNNPNFYVRPVRGGP